MLEYIVAKKTTCVGKETVTLNKGDRLFLGSIIDANGNKKSISENVLDTDYVFILRTRKNKQVDDFELSGRIFNFLILSTYLKNDM